MPAINQRHSEARNRQRTGRKADLRTIVPCNFRLAGRLSNEGIRTLSALHETLAREVSTRLAAYLMVGCEMKLDAVEQVIFGEWLQRNVETSKADKGLVLRFQTSGGSPGAVLQADRAVLFPLVDLLLGGSGDTGSMDRELTDLDLAVLHSVLQMLSAQVESLWRPVELISGVEESGILQECFAPKEKIVVLAFGIETGSSAGVLRLLVPVSVAGMLLRERSSEVPQNRKRVRYFPGPGLRERLLDCDVNMAVELPNLRVRVKDLVALRPGSVLKLRASIKSPSILMIEGKDFFEAVAVRNGTQKAAQLLRSLQPNDAQKGSRE